MHPDRPTGDKPSFINLYCSYNILTSNSNRKIYDQNYVKFHIQRKGMQHPQYYIKIPPSRLHYPTKISLLAQYGLLKNKWRSRHIRLFLNLNYDMELFLKEEEFNRPISVSIPIIARAYCPVCFGSNTYCLSCKGVGSYKRTSELEIKLEGGISPDFILTIDLRDKKAGNMSHFKKDKLLIKAILKKDL